MKNIIMMLALLGVGVCVAGERVMHNAVGAPLQVPVVAAMAIAAAHGNNGQIVPEKPKHNARPLGRREDYNLPRKQEKHHSIYHRHGYSGKK